MPNTVTMSSKSDALPETIEALARILGDLTTGSQISEYFAKAEVWDTSSESTKWRRLAWVFAEQQAQDGHAGLALNAVRSLLSPVLFVREPDKFHAARRDVNLVLRFAGVEYLDTGEFRTVSAAGSVEDAAGRSRAIQSKVLGSRHPSGTARVWRYCTAELMADDYFHAVLEAAKGLNHRIREMSVESTAMARDSLIKSSWVRSRLSGSIHLRRSHIGVSTGVSLLC